jgi:dihydroflavonol-4-reductase
VTRATQFLVTGGTGFIGRHVVRALLGRGARVRLLARSEPKARALFDSSVEVVRGDLLDAASVRAACRGAELVVHIGGVYRFGRRDSRLLLATNRDGTEHVLAGAWACGAAKVVHVSSAGVLENFHEPICERDFPARVSAREHYRHSKWLAELVALRWAKAGLPVTIVSPTCPIGAGDDKPTPTGRMISDLLAHRFPFAARTALNIVDVGELADGILAAAERGRPGQRYILGHHNVWLRDFLEIVARDSGLPAPRVVLPWPVLAIGGVIGEAVGDTRLCWETARHCRKRQFFDLNKAREELGWSAQLPLETSVRAAMTWFRRSKQPETAAGEAGLVGSNATVS